MPQRSIHGSGEGRTEAFMKFTSPARQPNKNSWRKPARNPGGNYGYTCFSLTTQTFRLGGYPWPIHRSRTPEPYHASVWDESGVFCVDKGLWKNGNHFSTAFFRLILMVSFPPCAPLRWQGNLIRRESKTTENQVTRFPPGRRGPRSGAGVLYGKSLK